MGRSKAILAGQKPPDGNLNPQEQWKIEMVTDKVNTTNALSIHLLFSSFSFLIGHNITQINNHHNTLYCIYVCIVTYIDIIYITIVHKGQTE